MPDFSAHFDPGQREAAAQNLRPGLGDHGLQQNQACPSPAAWSAGKEACPLTSAACVARVKEGLAWPYDAGQGSGRPAKSTSAGLSQQSTAPATLWPSAQASRSPIVVQSRTGCQLRA